jgi:hypothetical protein
MAQIIGGIYFEADLVAEHITDRQAPAMSQDDNLGKMALLDQWRRQVGTH